MIDFPIVICPIVMPPRWGYDDSAPMGLWRCRPAGAM